MNYFPNVIQVIPTKDYKVYVYFDDGCIKLFDASPIIQQGIFQQLQDKNKFVDTCMVLNDTLAWDIHKNYDESECLDLDPIELYQSCPDVEEPEWLFTSKNSVIENANQYVMENSDEYNIDNNE